MGSSLERRKNVLENGNLLLAEEDERLLELDLLGLDVGDEIWGDEATVEAHALCNLNLVLNGASLFDSDDTLLADLLHSLCNEVADMGIAVSRDGGDLGNFGSSGNRLGVLRQELDNTVDGGLGTTTKVHRVATGGDVLHTLGINCSGQNGSGCSTVTSNLICF